LRKDGTQVPLEIGLTPVVTDEGMFVLSTIVDISARKRAEGRFRIAVESSPNGMVMIDRDGKIVLVNREIERMFGWSRAELLGHTIDMLVPERFRADHPADRKAFFEKPQARSMGMGRDLFGVRKDGTEIPLEIGLNPIETDEGLFVLGSVVDISARKRAEQDHQRLEDQLRQAQKMEAIGLLASCIAHDYNNVLMWIIGCGELVKHALPPGHAALPIIVDMCSAAERGASLTRDLLNFSRKTPVETKPAELNAVVRVAERMLRQMIGEDIALVVELCPSGGPLLGNPTHLEHILLNLAVNSRDAMPKGGRLLISTCDVELAEPKPTRGRVLPAGSYVTLSVEDAGVGMDAETLERLVEPFFTTKEVGPGTGLGLYTVYSIVDQLQGGIEVESSPGKGTRFTIYFPRLPTLLDAISRVAPVTSKPEKHVSACILVVEDERLIRSTIRQLLSRMGYQVLVAEDGATAIASARGFKGNIDLLLSDMVLTDTSGAEIAKVIQQERPGIQVLFMSAYPADLLVQQGRIAPGTATLEKPFDEETLARAVANALKATSAPRSGAAPIT
jgi:PAS domain S-box-containing protein